MDTFYVDLNEMTHKKGKLLRTWLFGAIIGIAVFLLTIALAGNYFRKTAIMLIPLLFYLALYVYFAYTAYRTKLYIRSDDFALEYKFGTLLRSTRTVIWQTVVKVKLGPTYIALFKRTGKKVVVRLGWLPYTKVVEIKSKIEQACSQMNIPCEHSSYNRNIR